MRNKRPREASSTGPGFVIHDGAGILAETTCDRYRPCKPRTREARRARGTAESLNRPTTNLFVVALRRAVVITA